LFGAAALILALMPLPTVASSTTNPYGPLTTFKTENVLPPAAVYVSPQDQILISAISPSLAATVTVNWRLLTPQGIVITNQGTFNTTLAAAGRSLVIPPSEGYLMSLTVVCGAAVRGQMFVRAYLLGGSGLTAADPVDQLLIQGYLNGFDSIAYPQSVPESSLSGRGWIHGVTIAPPGAGGLPLLSVPSFVRWQLKSVFTSLICSPVVATRLPECTIYDNHSNPIAVLPAAAVQTANSSSSLSWFDGASAISISAPPSLVMGMASVRDLVMAPSWFLQLDALNMDPGDAFQETFVFVEEWASQN